MYSCTLSLTSAIDGGRWSTTRPGRFTPRKDTVSIVQESGWASGPVWTGAENLAPTGIRPSDRPTQSLTMLFRPTGNTAVQFNNTNNNNNNNNNTNAGHLKIYTCLCLHSLFPSKYLSAVVYNFSQPRAASTQVIWPNATQGFETYNINTLKTEFYLHYSYLH